MNPPEHLCESERDTHGERWREIERAQGEDKRRKLIEKKEYNTHSSRVRCQGRERGRNWKKEAMRRYQRNPHVIAKVD